MHASDNQKRAAIFPIRIDVTPTSVSTRITQHHDKPSRASISFNASLSKHMDIMISGGKRLDGEGWAVTIFRGGVDDMRLNKLSAIGVLVHVSGSKFQASHVASDNSFDVTAYVDEEFFDLLQKHVIARYLPNCLRIEVQGPHIRMGPGMAGESIIWDSDEDDVMSSDAGDWNVIKNLSLSFDTMLD